jgi:hypothetical protein
MVKRFRFHSRDEAMGFAEAMGEQPGVLYVDYTAAATDHAIAVDCDGELQHTSFLLRVYAGSEVA